MTAHGFDKAKTLRRMDDEGLIVRAAGQRGYGKQKRIRGTKMRPYMICVDGVALERFLGRALGDDAAGGGVGAGAGAGGAVAASGVGGGAGVAAGVGGVTSGETGAFHA